MHFLSTNPFNGKPGFKDFAFFVPLLHGLVSSMLHAAPTPELGDYKSCFWLTEDEVSATKEVIFYSF